MNLNPVRRHSALAVQGVEEPQSNDLDDGVPRHSAKCFSSLLVQRRERVPDRAVGMGDLRYKHRLIDFEIANDEVDIGVLVLRERRDKSSAQKEGLELDARPCFSTGTSSPDAESSPTPRP